MQSRFASALHVHVRVLVCACASVHTCLSLVLNGSSKIQRFEHAKVIEIRDVSFLPGTATYVFSEG